MALKYWYLSCFEINKVKFEFLVFFFFWLYSVVCMILPLPPALEVWSPNHWTTREFTKLKLLKLLKLKYLLELSTFLKNVESNDKFISTLFKLWGMPSKFIMAFPLKNKWTCFLKYSCFKILCYFQVYSKVIWFYVCVCVCVCVYIYIYVCMYVYILQKEWRDGAKAKTTPSCGWDW